MNIVTVGELFDNEPEQWGYRGDPYLWHELRDTLKTTNLPNQEAQFRRLLEDAFWEATGETLSFCDTLVIERFAHGGMSSGGISGEFWRQRGFPLVIERYQDSVWRASRDK